MNEYELERDAMMKKDINNIIWTYGCKEMTLERAENISCFIYYALHGEMITAVNILGRKTFNEHWGDRSERWNGVLDIKNFSREIWDAAREVNI